jgi:hypothetical protein
MTTTEHDDEPRADLALLQSWRFTVSKRDAMLILQALGGRLAGDELDEARALGDRLTALRVRSIEAAAGNAAKLRENVERSAGRTIEQMLLGAELAHDRRLSGLTPGGSCRDPAPPLLTCHKCRHQQARREPHGALQTCARCGSTDVWL